MQRNPDILRDIMLVAEKQPAGQKLNRSGLKGTSSNPHELGDYVQQLIELGYVDAVVHFHDSDTPPTIVIRRITSHGHDFLQAMREDTVWKLVKEKVMVPTASWTLALGVEWAQRYLRQKLGLP